MDGHEQRGAVRTGYRIERADNLVRDLEAMTATDVGGFCRARPIRRKLKRLQSGKLPFPVRELFAECAAREPLALPDSVVAVVNR